MENETKEETAGRPAASSSVREIVVSLGDVAALHKNLTATQEASTRLQLERQALCQKLRERDATIEAQARRLVEFQDRAAEDGGYLRDAILLLKAYSDPTAADETAREALALAKKIEDYLAAEQAPVDG